MAFAEEKVDFIFLSNLLTTNRSISCGHVLFQTIFILVDPELNPFWYLALYMYAVLWV